MKIALLLHFYQPYSQQKDILDRVVNESYRPLFKGLLANPRAKIIVNIAGTLTKLLMDNHYQDVIEDIKILAEKGQIEFTESSVYHAFLPLIPEKEIERQIEQNRLLNKKLIGNLYNPVGFFSPEMALNDKIFKIASKLGYKWMPASHLASIDGQYEPNFFYKHDKYDLNIFFRNKRVSSLILSAQVRDAQSLIDETRDLHESEKYWFCVMDAETFGHHRVGHEKVLFDILRNSFFDPVTISELLKEVLETKTVNLRDCTWTNEEQDFHLKGRVNSFVLWKDPTNPIHRMQWKLTDFVIKNVNNYVDKKDPKYITARSMLDKAIASDQYWWASAKPWWSLEMIESGAYSLKSVLEKLYGNNEKYLNAEKLYRQIMDKAFYWQRSGLIRKRHLQNSNTFMKEPFKVRAPKEWYNQIILEFEDEMNKASQKRDFEKAVKWRDAILKLDLGTDIYDVLHVVDELWSARDLPQVKPFLEHNWDELSDFAKKYLFDVKTEGELNEWKKRKEEEKR
ncbi:hypothetical protein A2V49_02080 [candidate division WWE3 bacterium RBG_19FT_COMBO_34_6]|uniref:UVR domain-containing protein n=1 Tax=candidate division WWE3 bacterium RBG_19FT_COMBO_34_6 TaxID=1802612 RepID=A0A1F4UK71_UNCKA|nr:MAG: hypothetical protein A2V49_02080 [candidate division WWE3 bacterium RBG_19FT_COMBO_34_6]